MISADVCSGSALGPLAAGAMYQFFGYSVEMFIVCGVLCLYQTALPPPPHPLPSPSLLLAVIISSLFFVVLLSQFEIYTCTFSVQEQTINIYFLYF